MIFLRKFRNRTVGDFERMGGEGGGPGRELSFGVGGQGGAGGSPP